MADQLPWMLDLVGRVFTSLLGASIPISILWEVTMPPADKETNMILGLFEGVLAVTGYIMMASIIAESLNPVIPDWSSSAPGLCLAPFFLPNAIEKLRRWRREITNMLSLWPAVKVATE